MMSRVLTCAVVLVLGACMSTQERVAVVPSSTDAPPSPAAPAAPINAATPLSAGAHRETFGWARSDGQRISGNATLTTQARDDIGTCKAESPPSGATGVRGEPCMRGRGYYVRALD
jgi:hypothetical protein